MKYSDIVGLQEYFQPIYSMEHESHEYWKRFIPNDQFYEILNTTMIALSSTDQKHKKSLWIQGAYGTGKSHASAVIKHMLWDEIETFKDYLNSFNHDQLVGKVTNYRKENRILPVVLVGCGSITNNRTFALEIEKAVKKSLQKVKIKVETKSDFERMIDKIEDEDYLNWEKIIKENKELEFLVNNKQEIARELRTGNVTLLNTLEKTLNNRGYHFSHEKISEWLTELTDEIVRTGKASGIMIFWDEFTPILELENSSGILEQLQNIAELSQQKKLFLYVISHRSPSQAKIAQEDIQKDIDKIKDRFHDLSYSMEPVTTYHILSASVKKNNTEWKKQKEMFYSKNENMNEIIERIAQKTNSSIKNKLSDLYPIHPYSAYLSTFISKNLGSTQRSIFEFLYDEDRGFKRFIQNEIKDYLLLTPDYLWDYFMNDFENDPRSQFSQILEKYRLYEKKMQTMGSAHSQVFKGMLLLNILYKVVETGSPDNTLVNPTAENIHSLFVGCGFETDIKEILDYIDTAEIIQKNPDDLFLISFTDLPHKEVDEEKKRTINEYKEVVKIIKIGDLEDTFKSIFENVLREQEVVFFSCLEDNKFTLGNKLLKAFKSPHTLHIAVFLLKDEAAKGKINSLIKQISNDEELRNIIFIIMEEPLGDKNFSRFTEYMARSSVSRNHNYEENAANLEDYAKKIVLEWIGRIEKRYFDMWLGDFNIKNLVSKISVIINSKISSRIFESGIDVLNEIKKYATIWKKQAAKAALEIFFYAKSIEYLEEKTSKGYNQYLRHIIKDANGEYILNRQLNLKNNADPNNPLTKISKAVDRTFASLQTKAQFNLGDELQFLTKPPYGIYQNMPNMALIGLVMRNYNGALYQSGTGELIENKQMIDKIILLFEYWDNGKNRENLNVKFGSQQEKELIALLKDIFDLEDVGGLTKTKWEVKKYTDKMGFPIWSLKYHKKNEVIKNFSKEIFELIKSVDKEIELKDIERISALLKEWKYDIKSAVKPDNFKIGFTNYLKSIENVEMTDEDVPEAITYLGRHLQEEVSLWEEVKVSSIVKDWRLEKNREEKEKPGIYPFPWGGSEPGTTPDNPDALWEISKENAVKKVTSFSGDLSSLKQKIIKIIEENPKISWIIEKYF